MLITFTVPDLWLCVPMLLVALIILVKMNYDILLLFVSKIRRKAI